MDRTTRGFSHEPRQIAYGLESEKFQAGRPSTEQPSARLQKKRLAVGVYGDGEGRGGRYHTHSQSVQQEPETPFENSRMRRGSIRSAVRKIFGRRSRESEPGSGLEVPNHLPQSRHGYHISEPPRLATQLESPERRSREGDRSQRGFSVPAPFAGAETQRARSPYAVEFPRSARLKPLALGDPFFAPGSQLRRRKTLPSIQVSEKDADSIAIAIQEEKNVSLSADEFAAFSADEGAVDTVFTSPPIVTKEKRWSRSMDNLGREALRSAHSTRKRSDEIRYWRESFHAEVLRASGFRQPPAVIVQDDTTSDREGPPPGLADPFVENAAPAAVSPQSRLDMSETEFVSPSTFGMELSRDLEDRMAKLESHLQHFLHHFQDELQKLTVDKQRRPGAVQPDTWRRPLRSQSDNGRTASMLLENFHYPTAPSNYQYEHSLPQQEPMTPPRPTHSTKQQSPPAEPSSPREHEPVASDASSGPIVPSFYTALSGYGSNQSHAQRYNFRSLYEMLSDERSARRNLEEKLRGLQQEVMNLQYQVSNSSNIQSQRSSYLPHDATTGSSRLHALLRETETEMSPPGTAGSGVVQPDHAPYQHAAEVSRFSGSESDIA